MLGVADTGETGEGDSEELIGDMEFDALGLCIGDLDLDADSLPLGDSV